MGRPVWFKQAPTPEDLRNFRPPSGKINPKWRPTRRCRVYQFNRESPPQPMAKKSTKAKNNALVIVESPAKARTIGKYLGPGYTVEASVGHVRDLAEGKKEMPEELKGEPWAEWGVNVDDNFEPYYVVDPDKKKQISNLKKLLKQSDKLYLATDEDREGEAISWHLCELLEPKVPVHRMVFHEITEEAIKEALSNPREIDTQLVQAQEARRIVDRLYGYGVSPLLWRKVILRSKSNKTIALSAGRVQSVAVRLLVERERERMKFHTATWWDLLGRFAKQSGGADFEATLMEVDVRKLPTGKNFDPDTGRIKDDKLLLLDEAGARELAERLRGSEFKVTAVEEKPYTRKPPEPFITSSLQQESSRQLGFDSDTTMRLAQSLYQNGHITYMRTDSKSLAEVAVEAARDLVRSEYGPEFLPEKANRYKSKVKNAQEAHEAIRPAGHPFEIPSALQSQLSSAEFRLFDLIWKRTVASQMKDARGRNIVITIEGGGATFRVTGRTIDFPGFLRAYVEGSDDPDAELADREKLLPDLQEGEVVDCKDLEPKSHTTQPPARYTESTLIAKLEELGIGRPSTYASIIKTVQARNYTYKKGKALVPTWVAMTVVNLLETHLKRLVDYSFTAKMEDELDAISRGELEHVIYLDRFYHGGSSASEDSGPNGQRGLKQMLENKLEEIDTGVIATFPLGKPEEGENTNEVIVRLGQYGPYIQQEGREKNASLPDDLAPDEVTLDLALELLARAQLADQPLGTEPESGKPVFLKEGRFGTYVQLGSPDDDEKPKNASLLPGMEADDVDLETALKLLSLPRVVGVKPETTDEIQAFNGRYGPYIKCGTETRSLPADVSPLDVTLEQAVEILAQPKRGRGGSRTPREPLKTFDKSPVTDEPIKLLDGRYGPYVTDGTTNASLPKTLTPEECTFEKACDLLAERAAKGGKKKKKANKKTAKKKTTKKKAAKKKTTKKKTAKSSTAKKAAKKSS